MKNSGQNKLDQILKDKLSEGTAQVPDFVWDRIEEELFPYKKRRVLFWWFFGGFCLLLIGVFMVMAVSGTKVHSQHVVISEHLVAKETKAPASEIGKQTKTDRSSAINGSETMDGSQLDDSDNYRNAANKHDFSVSKDSRINLKPIQKTNGFSSKNRIKSGSSARIKNTLTKSSIRSKVENNEHTPTHTPSVNNSADLVSPVTKTEPAQIKDKNLPAPSASKNEDLKTLETETNPPLEKELSYAEILKLIQRDFPKVPDNNPSKRIPSSCVSIGIFGGPSLYHSAVFKDYFTSGQLSKRTFASSGFELGLQARVKLGDRFQIYAGFAFNQKQTQFRYNVAITEADYFTYIENGEKVPLENIHDDGMNSCFLAAGVTAKYKIQTTSISIGASFEFLRIGKFSAAADLRLSGNLYSSLKLQEILVLDIAQPSSETFSQLQPGAGLLFNYQLNDRISLGLSPFLSKQFYLKKSFLHRMDELVIPVTCSFRL